jgi:hypothetical protein
LGVVYFEQLYENGRSRQGKIFGFFFHGTSYVLILTKMFLGYILGHFFTNSSGRPAFYINLNFVVAAKTKREGELFSTPIRNLTLDINLKQQQHNEEMFQHFILAGGF